MAGGHHVLCLLPWGAWRPRNDNASSRSKTAPRFTDWETEAQGGHGEWLALDGDGTKEMTSGPEMASGLASLPRTGHPVSGCADQPEGTGSRWLWCPPTPGHWAHTGSGAACPFWGNSS